MAAKDAVMIVIACMLGKINNFNDDLKYTDTKE